jgi:hypothetical protein
MGFQLIWTKTTDATFRQTTLNFSLKVKSKLLSCKSSYLRVIT